MTKEEFEQGYAERSGCTVEELHKMGRRAVACDCGHESCRGWAMGHFWVDPDYAAVISPGAKNVAITQYICPHCSTPSREMKRSENRIELPADLAIPPQFDGIANEILICKCGEPLTWFDLLPVLTQAAPGGTVQETAEEQSRRLDYEAGMTPIFQPAPAEEAALFAIIGKEVSPSEAAQVLGYLFHIEPAKLLAMFEQQIEQALGSRSCPVKVRIEKRSEEPDRFEDYFRRHQGDAYESSRANDYGRS